MAVVRRVDRSEAVPSSDVHFDDDDGKGKDDGPVNAPAGDRARLGTRCRRRTGRRGDRATETTCWSNKVRFFPDDVYIPREAVAKVVPEW